MGQASYRAHAPVGTGPPTQKPSTLHQEARSCLGFQRLFPETHPRFTEGVMWKKLGWHEGDTSLLRAALTCYWDPQNPECGPHGSSQEALLESGAVPAAGALLCHLTGKTIGARARGCGCWGESALLVHSSRLVHLQKSNRGALRLPGRW